MSIVSSSWNSFISSTITFPSPSMKPKNSSSLYIINSTKKPTLQIHDQKSTATPFDRVGSLLFNCGAILATVKTPAALAVTGENGGGDDLLTTVISVGIIAVLYLFVVPPILMNWMRLRWYKRKFLEMYLQFMFVFIFFPGLLLWAPFVNFRKFPRDPTMKYPWSTPKDDVPLYKIR